MTTTDLTKPAQATPRTTGAMRRLRPHAGRRRRATTMLEFILILPAMLFVSLFTVDMGNVILTNGAMQDAAYSAARAGAQVGGGSLDTQTGTYPCGLQSSGPSCHQGAAYDSFAWSLSQVTGYTSGTFSDAKMQIVTGGKCTATSTASRSDNHVTVKVTYTQRVLTPGLTLLMGWTGSAVDGKWQMSVTGTSRCEIVR